MKQSLKAGLTVALAAALGATLAQVADATNPGTKDGVRNDATACTLDWHASAVLDANLTNDDAEYPGLMQDFDGNTVHYSNGGYIEEVTPLLGDAPGLFEMNHFYIPQVQPDGVQVWRIPTATDKTITNATVTFTPPAEVDPAQVTFDAVSVNDRIVSWGGNYAKYEWLSDKATHRVNEDGTVTVDLGTLEAGTATVYQFTYPMPGGGKPESEDARYVAQAVLTGDLDAEAGDCVVPQDPSEDPTPGDDPSEDPTPGEPTPGTPAPGDPTPGDDQTPGDGQAPSAPTPGDDQTPGTQPTSGGEPRPGLPSTGV